MNNSNTNETKMSKQALYDRAMERTITSVNMDRTSLQDWQDFIIYMAIMDTSVQHRRRCVEAAEVLQLTEEDCADWPLRQLHQTVFGCEIYDFYQE